MRNEKKKPLKRNAKNTNTNEPIRENICCRGLEKRTTEVGSNLFQIKG